MAVQLRVRYRPDPAGPSKRPRRHRRPPTVRTVPVATGPNGTGPVHVVPVGAGAGQRPEPAVTPPGAATAHRFRAVPLSPGLSPGTRRPEATRWPGPLGRLEISRRLGTPHRLAAVRGVAIARRFDIARRFGVVRRLAVTRRLGVVRGPAADQAAAVLRPRDRRIVPPHQRTPSPS
ncbi:hypothetical protein NUM_10360 [Actinocatenispora comari]|uniref:Uncharacterized protein n=1 Tax=Actinocatenispora comari TaxID=2807577 RepID=A0A8J4A9U7_9ACTN|nr:hypothetical protein NUM_10360 [Actinocatenispora comari]